MPLWVDEVDGDRNERWIGPNHIRNGMIYLGKLWEKWAMMVNILLIMVNIWLLYG